MHEMSIAQGIMDIALDYAGRNGARSIHEIGLRIGEMAGVVPESLEFSFRMIAKGTPAENALLKLSIVPLTGKCNICGKETHIENYNFLCPSCEDGVLGILSGREMQVEYLEVD